MRALNIFGLRIAGITLVLLLVLFGLYWGGKKLLPSSSAPEATAPAQQSLADVARAQDSDGDGVADWYETTFYKTDPNKVDTDDDGTSDRDEIIAGRDPLTPGPNDESRPSTGQNVPAQDTFTQRYLASLPEDIPREDILNQDRIKAFIDANKGPLLPDIAPESIKTTSAEGKEAISAYLDNISSAHNPDLNVVTSDDLTTAFRLQITAQLSVGVQEIITKLEHNLDVLRAVEVPAEAVDLHRTFLAASQALLDNTRLVGNVNADFVGALVGAEKIEELAAVFQEIANDVQSLEDKYGLE